MGESRKDALRLDFDRELKVAFGGTTVPSDAGLLAHREPDDVFGLTDTADEWRVRSLPATFSGKESSMIIIGLDWARSKDDYEL